MRCAKALLLDHLVGGREQRRRHLETQRLGGPQIDDKLILGWQLHRQVSGLFALENPAGIDPRLSKQPYQIDAI
jgi:hypothetical protein